MGLCPTPRQGSRPGPTIYQKTYKILSPYRSQTPRLPTTHPLAKPAFTETSPPRLSHPGHMRSLRATPTGISDSWHVAWGGSERMAPRYSKSAVHRHWDGNATALKAAGYVGTKDQLRSRVLVAQQKEPQPSEGHSANSATCRVVCSGAAWSIRCSDTWTWRAPTLRKFFAQAQATQNAQAVAECGLACAPSLAFSTTRWADWSVVIPALDFEDQLGSARLAVVRPCVLAFWIIRIHLARHDENGHSGRRLTWKRKAVCLRKPHGFAVIRRDRDDARESLVSQCRQKRAATS